EREPWRLKSTGESEGSRGRELSRARPHSTTRGVPEWRDPVQRAGPGGGNC
ncbi:hypothetical protein NDU88_000414, partial [Pleurodeles waltl]